MDEEGSNVRVRRSIFFCLARCLNEVMGIDNKAHSCENGDRCPISLLMKVFQHMRGKDLRLIFKLKTGLEGQESSQIQAVCITLPASGDWMSAALRNYWKERETCNYCSMDRIQVRECKGFPKSIAFRILRRGPLETLFIMEYDFKIQDARYKLQAVITNENGEFIPYFWQENELFSWKPEKVKAQIYDVRKFFTTGFLMFYEKIPDGAIEQQQQGPEWDLQNERALLLELQRPESQVNCISKKLTKSDVELNSYLLLPFREVEAYLEEELKGRKSRDILQFQSVLNFDTKKKYKGLLLQCWKDGYRLAGGWRKLVKSMNLKVGQTIELYWFNVELLEICRAESSPEGDGTQENDAEGDATSSSLSI